MKFYILLAFALCMLSCSSKRSVVQSSVATSAAGSSIDTASHVAEADSMRATSSAEVQKQSETTQESETLRVTDTVIIWEHADGTTDKKSTHTEERIRSKNAEKNSEMAKSKTDTTNVNIKTADEKSHIEERNSSYCSTEEKVVKKTGNGYLFGFYAALALCVLIVLVFVFLYLRRKSYGNNH